MRGDLQTRLVFVFSADVALLLHAVIVSGEVKLIWKPRGSHLLTCLSGLATSLVAE